MRHWIYFAPLVVLVALASAARADLEELNVKGKVVEIGPRMIVVQTEAGEKWFASTDPKRIGEDNVIYGGIPEAKIEVTGTETADVLRAGLIVRFAAEVERKKLIKKPVDELTIIGPGKDDLYGLLPEGGAGPGETKDADTEHALVVGPLIAASRGAITVGLPENKSIKAKLSPEAVVRIASSDVQFARPGDEVELKGYYLRAPRVFATVVNVKRVAKAEKGPRKPAASPKRPEVASSKSPKESALPEFGEGDPRDAQPAEKPDDKPVSKPAGPAKANKPGRILKVN